MKKRLLLLLLLLAAAATGPTWAQIDMVRPMNQSTFRISYQIAVSGTKTTHLIFPHEITYADLGSKDIVGEAIEKAGNVFRVKAVGQMGFSETSLTVITADGRLYSFRVHFESDPAVITYDLTKPEPDPIVPKTVKIGTGTPARLADRLNELGSQAMATHRRIKHVGHQEQGVSIYLKNVLYQDDVMFLVLGMDNDSKLDYGLDFMRVFIHQVKRGENSATQELPVDPLKVFSSEPTIPHRQTVTQVVAISRMTLERDRQLVVQVNEKGGGRRLTLGIGPEELATAHPL